MCPSNIELIRLIIYINNSVSAIAGTKSTKLIVDNTSLNIVFIMVSTKSNRRETVMGNTSLPNRNYSLLYCTPFQIQGTPLNPLGPG